MGNYVIKTAVLCILVGLGGCSGVGEGASKELTDSEISKMLIGEWAAEGDNMSGVNHYQKDGTLKATGTISVNGSSIDISLLGSWKVSNGTIIATVTETNVPQIIREGHTSKDKVIAIDDKRLVYVTEDGKESTRKRINR